MTQSTSTLEGPKLANVALAGTYSGMAATGAMSGVMLGLQKLGWLGKAPPRHVVERGLTWFGLRRRLSRRLRKVLSAIFHVGFGAAQGAVYSLLRRAFSTNTDDRPASPRSGVPFALGLWGASYAGWIPALGILPKPHNDRRDRTITMLVAHVVYGVVLAKVLRKLLARE